MNSSRNICTGHYLLLIITYHPRRYIVGIFETHFFGETLFKESTTGIPYSFTKYYTVLIIAFQRFLKSMMFFFNIASKLILYFRGRRVGAAPTLHIILNIIARRAQNFTIHPTILNIDYKLYFTFFILHEFYLQGA